MNVRSTQMVKKLELKDMDGIFKSAELWGQIQDIRFSRKNSCHSFVGKKMTLFINFIITLVWQANGRNVMVATFVSDVG